MKDPLEGMVEALDQDTLRRAAGTRGERIEVRCPGCSFHAWSYECYLPEGETIAYGEAWLLAQHDCEDHLPR